ncbi:monocarboxylate transporter 12-like [Lineus longissimus]|uniref:monocarboxylate transporter 12-like n=1 Tax=Lineus longissimus TaxID=88925 RepID=UPI002B4D1EEB
METSTIDNAKSPGQKLRRRSSVVTTTRPPDGGYGWVVCAASFYATFLTAGTIMCYGVIYVEFLDYFRETRTKTSWIGSLTLMSFSLAGPLSSVLSIRFGHRFAVIFGGIISAISMAVSALADSIYFLYASFGIFGGLGMGLALTPTISLVALYFDRRRSTAIAIAFSGGGISYLVFPPMMDICMDAITWRGVMFVLAALWMQCCICGALLRPLTVREDIFMARRMSRFSISDKVTERRMSRFSITSDKVAERRISRFSIISDKIGENEGIEEIEAPPGACDVVLFRNWRFWMYLLQEFLWRIDFMNFPSILPDFAILNGYNKMQSGLLLTIFGCTVVPSRLLGGWAVDRTKANPFFLQIILIAGIGAMNIIMPFTGSSYIAMAVVCGTRGAFIGFLPVIGPSILVHLFTKECMTSSLGYATLACGAGELIAPPIGGVIYDQTGNYMYAYLTCAFISFLAAVVALVLFLDTKKKHKLDRVRVQGENANVSELEGLKNSTV